MSLAVTVDVAGGPIGGAARFRFELYQYLERSGRTDVRVIGADRRVDPAWLVRRELAHSAAARRVALNNVGFVMPGGERWTLLGNALHFLTDQEIGCLHPSLRSIAVSQALVVRTAARRSDVLIAPCTAMAERVVRFLPGARDRLVVRMHPVSPDLGPDRPGEPDEGPETLILCPVIFEAYKEMDERLAEWADAVAGDADPAIRLVVTADAAEVPARLADSPGFVFAGRMGGSRLRGLWRRARAVYFPTGLESFGYPLAEARAYGLPVIARDTTQNREIAGQALFGYIPGERDSLAHAIGLALRSNVAPDPLAFDPDDYFGWLIGPSR